MAGPSTRDQILAGMAAKGTYAAPSATLSSEEVEALVASRRFRAEVGTPLPGKHAAWQRPLSQVDSPREVQFSMSPLDRNFWFNLVIGCSGPDSRSRTINALRSRNAAKLAYTTTDVRRLKDYAKNPFDDPQLILPVGARALAGTFAEIVYLSDPGPGEFDRALDAIGSFFERNEKDPEWDGGQVNLFFAGHGGNNPSALPTERGWLLVHGRVVGPRELQSRMMAGLPRSVLEDWHGVDGHGNCRVDMYLDCCYSGQFALAFIGRLVDTARGLVPGLFWCSCMPDQESFESDDLRQGVFSSYFLNDYSTKNALSPLRRFFRRTPPSLRRGDVTKNTNNKQNPFLIDFTAKNSPQLTVPGVKRYPTFSTSADALSQGDSLAQSMTHYLEAVRSMNW